MHLGIPKGCSGAKGAREAAAPGGTFTGAAIPTQIYFYYTNRGAHIYLAPGGHCLRVLSFRNKIYIYLIVMNSNHATRQSHSNSNKQYLYPNFHSLATSD